MIRLKSMFSTNTYIQLLSYTKIGGHFLHNSAGMTAVRLSDAKAAWRCYYDRGHRRAVLCPVYCWDGCGESAGKLKKTSVPRKQCLYIQDKNVKRNGGGFLPNASRGIVHGAALHA